MVKALDQVAEMIGLGTAELGAEALVPSRRLAELARYGMSADTAQLRRHADGRRLATLLATVRFLEAKSIDDALELLDLLMATELLNKAQTAAKRRRSGGTLGWPGTRRGWRSRWRRCSNSAGWGGEDEEPRVAEVWEAMEAIMSRAELRAALVRDQRQRPAR